MTFKVKDKVTVTHGEWAGKTGTVYYVEDGGKVFVTGLRPFGLNGLIGGIGLHPNQLAHANR
ncbi:hypothetical protein OG689_10880 [Kitasatospora sp. NBC_00240]|uniref:hypothetical protein n=1 Tax=Kitasatospora sp. NBC_00240 TaxID=2903567 RepID=UPI002251A6C7|nr:hypothetical protein [Kitasatospora sp. NBC_00240]MCX5209788.1 hypothetical protein [Kitasatospora sp. NBC_00240]